MDPYSQAEIKTLPHMNGLEQIAIDCALIDEKNKAG